MRTNWRYFTQTERTLREIEKLLETKPFVKVCVSPQDAEQLHVFWGGEGIYLLVTEVCRGSQRLKYFDPYGKGNFAVDYTGLQRFSVGENQYIELNPNPGLNALILSTHKSGSSGRARKRMRVGYDHDNNPVYLPDTLHVHKGSSSSLTKWGSVACFEVAALEVDNPNYDYPIAYTYYPHYGTLGLKIDYGPWLPHPRWVDYEQQARDKLQKEYQAYKAKPPFLEGDIIQSPGFPERVFIRYEDPDRTRMVVFPGKVIEGAESIARFQLIQRGDLVRELIQPELPNPITPPNPHLLDPKAANELIDSLLDSN